MRAVAVICLSCVVHIGAAVAQSDAAKSKTSKSSQFDQRGTKQQPLVIEGLPAPQGEAESRNEREHRAQQAAVGASVSKAIEVVAAESVVTTKLTIVLVTVALLQALLFGIQLWMMNRNLRDTRIAALAAELSAKATQASVTVMEQTAKRQLRAYVDIRSVLLHDYDATPRAQVTVINTGQTPAHNVTALVTISLLPYPPPSVLPRQPPAGHSRSTLGAGGAMSVLPRLPNPLTDADRNAVASGSHIIIVHGEIHYQDVFGDDHTSTLKFACGGRYGAPPADKHMTVCEDGNETD